MEERNVQGLLDLFFKTNDIRKLVDEASKVLKNPLLVCDTSYHFLAYSDITGIKDKSWLIGIKRGNWSYELVSMISFLDLDYGGLTHKTQILANINDLSSHRRMIGTLCVDGSHLGYYLLLEEHTPFDEITEETYQQVEMILSKCMCIERPFRLSSKGERCESIILDLLQSHFDSEHLFMQRAAKNELSRKGSYRAFCIDVSGISADATKAHSLIHNQINDIRSSIGQHLPLSWQVLYKGYIVVLADFSSKLYQNTDTLNRLNLFLEEKQLVSGLSDVFSNTYYLQRYYQQACSALYFGKAFEDSRRIIPFEDYKVFSMFQNISDNNLFTQYSTEVIRTICQYDKDNGTAYFETLFHYLGNHCSVNKAAQALYVHRNTVAYRISRIEELFGLTFDDDFKNYNNYTSCLLRKYCDRSLLPKK